MKRLLAVVVALTSYVALAQLPSSSVAPGSPAIGPNAAASSTSAVTNLTITHNLNTTNVVYACVSGTGTGPFTPVTVTSLTNVSANAITLNFTSTANVTCIVNGAGGVGPQGQQGPPGSTGAVTAAGALVLQHVSSQSTPNPNTTIVYGKDDGNVYKKTPDGTESQIGVGSAAPFLPKYAGATRTSSTQLTLPDLPPMRQGWRVCPTIAAGQTVTVGTGTGVVRLVRDRNCSLVARTNLGGVTGSSEITVVSGTGTGQPGDIPIEAWNATSGVLATSGTVEYVGGSGDGIVAGVNVTETPDYVTGQRKLEFLVLGTGIKKGDGNGALVDAVQGVDYERPLIIKSGSVASTSNSTIDNNLVTVPLVNIPVGTKITVDLFATHEVSAGGAICGSCTVVPRFSVRLGSSSYLVPTYAWSSGADSKYTKHLEFVVAAANKQFASGSAHRNGTGGVTMTTADTAVDMTGTVNLYINGWMNGTTTETVTLQHYVVKAEYPR